MVKTILAELEKLVEVDIPQNKAGIHSNFHFNENNKRLDVITINLHFLNILL